MLLTIQNKELRVSVDTRGAQMMHIQDKTGREYLWQGDPAYWPDRAPTLFPYIARLTENRYTYRGTSYPMAIHGFALSSDFVPAEHTGDRLVLELCDSPATREQYPFAFSFRVTYALCGSQLDITYTVENHSAETMPFAVGGHPGFFVGTGEGEAFEDYELVFSQPCQPDRVGFTPDVFLSGKDEPYPLEDGYRLPLRHTLFDDDAIILKNMDRQVTLRSTRPGQRAITVTYPDFPYLGIWHWPKTDAPYVCIEPWSSLPSRQGIVEELTCKSDLLRLPAGCTYETTWSLAWSAETK